MDPVTISLAVGVASKAFSAIKQGFAVGRDIEQMSGDIGRWMGAVSDVDNAEKQAKNPPLFGKLLNMTHGPGAYDELLQMEGQIRKDRQKTIYKQQQMRQQIGEGIAWLFLALVVGGALLLLASIFSNRSHADGYTYKSKSLTRQQKINQGIIKPPVLTICRLKKQKTYKGKVGCIYQGANRTFELSFQDTRIGCVKSFRCKLNPNGKEPSIDSVMESLRSIAK